MWSKRSPQAHIRIENSVLVEVDNTQTVSAYDLACRRLILIRQKSKKRGFAASVRSDQANPGARRHDKVQVTQNRTPVDLERSGFQLDQPLGLPIGGREVNVCSRGASSRVQIVQLSNQFVSFIDPGFRLGRPRLWTAAQPLNLGPNPIAERLLLLVLANEKLVFLLEEVAVTTGDPENAFRIDPVHCR